MKPVLQSLLLVLLIASPLCESAAATPIALYHVNLSVNVTINALTDGNGNPLTTIPSDLSITGSTPVFDGFNYFNFYFGPNRPQELSSSSGEGTAGVIVGGRPAGHGSVALGIGDGFTLNSTVSGSLGGPIWQGFAFVSSDISQSGDVKFVNTSASTTYTADVLVRWIFDVTVQNDSSFLDGFRLDTGYLFDVARRTESTGGTDYFFDYGFVTALYGEGDRIIGSEVFTTLFAVAPGEEPILTARTFVGGIGSAPPIIDPFSGETGARVYPPEPPTLSLFVLGGMLLIGYRFRHRKRSRKADDSIEDLTCPQNPLRG